MNIPILNERFISDWGVVKEATDNIDKFMSLSPLWPID